MDDTTREHFIALCAWTGASTRGLGDLLLRCGSPQAVMDAPVEELAALPPATARALWSARMHWPRRPPGRGANTGQPCEFLPISDHRYPRILREIPDPPPWLFCRGDPATLRQRSVAIVGSRRASQAGLRIAREFAASLAAAGYSICSGLALGIDAAAHRGALESGRSVAVLATGADLVYPQRHTALAEGVRRSGCLVSELPPGTPARKQHFPMRNRIISGLSQATIIVEAALPSGSLHTAASALEQGRDVYVLPWSVFHAQGAGCLRLLRDGATPITHPDELHDYFPGLLPEQLPGEPPGLFPQSSPGVVASAAAAAGSGPEPGGAAGEVLRLVGEELLSLDALQVATGIAPGLLMGLLGELEIKGFIRREQGNYFRAVGKPCQAGPSC